MADWCTWPSKNLSSVVQVKLKHYCTPKKELEKDTIFCEFGNVPL